MHHTYQTLHNWQRLPWLWLKGSCENSSGWQELSIINKSHARTQRAVLTQTKHFSPSEVSALCSVNRKITCPTLQIKMLCSKGQDNHLLQLSQPKPWKLAQWLNSSVLLPMHLDRKRMGFYKAPFTLCFILKSSFTPSCHHHPEVVVQWFLQYTRIPSSMSIPLQPEESSSQDTGGAPQHCDPSHLGCLWTEVLGSSQFNHGDFTEAAPVGQCLQEGNATDGTDFFLQPHSMASGFSSLLQALPIQLHLLMLAQHLRTVPPPANWGPYGGQVLWGTIHCTGAETHWGKVRYKTVWQCYCSLK